MTPNYTFVNNLKKPRSRGIIFIELTYMHMQGYMYVLSLNALTVDAVTSLYDVTTSKT